MKLLLDANISWRLTSVLEKHFDVCTHVDVIGLQVPAKDAEIWNFARKNDYIIVTHDDDFSNLMGINGFPPKIILLKTGNNTNQVITELLIKAKPAILELSENKECGLLEII